MSALLRHVAVFNLLLTEYLILIEHSIKKNTIDKSSNYPKLRQTLVSIHVLISMCNAQYLNKLLK